MKQGILIHPVPRAETPYGIKVFTETWCPPVEADKVSGTPYKPPFKRRVHTVTYELKEAALFKKLLQQTFDLRKTEAFQDVKYILAATPKGVLRFQFVQLPRDLGYPKKRWVLCDKFFTGYQDSSNWFGDTAFRSWLKKCVILTKDAEAQGVC